MASGSTSATCGRSTATWARGWTDSAAGGPHFWSPTRASRRPSAAGRGSRNRCGTASCAHTSTCMTSDAPAEPAAGGHEGRWWTPTDDGKLLCQLCPRYCRVGEGQRAFCFVRQNVGGKMVLTTYGRSSGFCIDPVEKKPLNQFYP